MQKLWNKLVFGFKDYCVENGFDKVCLGLSGGIDSAVCAVIAKKALGAENVYAYMMKTNYTSELSLKIAKKISELNHIPYQVIDIQPEVDVYAEKLSNIFNEEPKDIVMQNVQARIRGQILMAISNQFGYLVLSCGNKSEAAMGYCTLYGDTCGGLVPIGDVYKTDVFKLAHWLNQKLGEVLPKEVLNRAPSAELKAGQKDEDSLPKYDVLDAILRQYIDEGKKKEEIKQNAELVDFVIKTYHKMAYKRKQLAFIVEVE
ncbi:MAG: NAD(+) synthase [Alphaproteobacteria bacterium]